MSRVPSSGDSPTPAAEAPGRETPNNELEAIVSRAFNTFAEGTTPSPQVAKETLSAIFAWTGADDSRLEAAGEAIESTRNRFVRSRAAEAGIQERYALRHFQTLAEMAWLDVKTGTYQAPLADDGKTIAGDVFLWDGPDEIQTRWGIGSEVLWAAGESVMIVGPPGTGKTTLVAQLVTALIGIEAVVLGYPVIEAKRVLYLALDRPKQIRRAMRRLFRQKDRVVQQERMRVRTGPPAVDLVKRPDMLLALAREHDCDVIIIDSLKDLALNLSADETGSAVNRAIQMCNADGVDVCVLHHQRKSGAEGSKPKTLADVYGSAWLTAGTGSVLLLWGESGSEQVELIHLKQPADTVGPLKLEHDHIAGTTSVVQGFDVIRYLRLQADAGATFAQIAQAEHGKPVAASSKEGKRTERKLRRLVDDKRVIKDPQESGNGTFSESRYRVRSIDFGGAAHR